MWTSFATLCGKNAEGKYVSEGGETRKNHRHLGIPFIGGTRTDCHSTKEEHADVWPFQEKKTNSKFKKMEQKKKTKRVNKAHRGSSFQ